MEDYNNNLPIYSQIAEKIKIEIFSGRFSPGEKIPSVRELAISERVNPNTIQKSLNELENSGLIITMRTNGKFITEDIELIMQQREKYAQNLTKNYEDKMRAVGAEINMPKIIWVEKEVKNDITRMPKSL